MFSDITNCLAGTAALRMLCLACLLGERNETTIKTELKARCCKSSFLFVLHDVVTTAPDEQVKEQIRSLLFRLASSRLRINDAWPPCMHAKLQPYLY